MTTIKPRRLAWALLTSGALMTATAGGPWAFLPSSLLWAAPLLVAVRCLPAVVAWPLVLVAGTLGRALSSWGALHGAELLLLPLAASLALVPALLLDRVLVDRFPRASLLAWPALLLLTVLVLEAAGSRDLVSRIVPAPSLEPLHRLEVTAGRPAIAFVVGSIAQGLGALGSVLNRARDSVSAVEREAGVRWGALVGLAVCVAVLLAALAGPSQVGP